MTDRRLAALSVVSLLAWNGCASHGVAPVELPAVNAAPATAAGFVVRRVTGGYSAVTNSANASVTFTNLGAHRCKIRSSCYHFAITQPPKGARARAPRACKVHQAIVTTVECPAKGNVAFHMDGGGTWFGFQADGTHPQGPCPTANIVLYTSSQRKSSTTVEAWDGCRETIECVKAKRASSIVQADNADVIRGKCTSVVRASAGQF